MTIERLETIIPNNEGKAMGELYSELLGKGFSDKDAQIIIQQHMATIASQMPKSEYSHEDPIGWRNLH